MKFKNLYGRGSLDLGGISNAGRATGFHVRCYRRFAFVNRVSFSLMSTRQTGTRICLKIAVVRVRGLRVVG